MRISTIVEALEAWAPKRLQEEYDNSGLLLGDPSAEVAAALVCLDVTEAVVEEAIQKGCGLIISHHPLIFKGMKQLVGNGPVERTVLKAIRANVGVLAIHTNLDNVRQGVNGEIADRLGLRDVRILAPRPDSMRKLVVFVPKDHVDQVRNAMFNAGAGRIGEYDQCSFNLEGEGTFRPGDKADPHVGSKGERHTERETRVEVVLSAPKVNAVVRAMLAAHPYQEPAYDILSLLNTHPDIGSGAIGNLPRAMKGTEFIQHVKKVFGIPVVRHSPWTAKPISTVALCGGAGAFLIRQALASGADAFVTGDVKYHDFFEADGRLLVTDVGHFGSEQFTMALIERHLGEIFPTFAVRLTETVTDPILYS